VAAVTISIEDVRGVFNVLTVRLDGPRGNELGIDLLKQLNGAFKVARSNRYSCLILKGSRHVFSVGARIDELLDPSTDKKLLKELAKAVRQLLKFQGLTVAAIEGYALGGGLELALSCDLLIGSETSQVGFPEVTLGILPGASGIRLASMRVGSGKSLEMLLSGRMVGSEQAFELGLIDYRVKAGEADSFAHELCSKIAVVDSKQITKIKGLIRLSSGSVYRYSKAEQRAVIKLLDVARTNKMIRP